MASLNRKQQLLKLIVEQFIKTAEPVGSKTLIETYKLPYSSATIRNEMAELENQGYLEKTHTSSGRVPSAAGYRYYVDNLREEKTIEEEAKKQIQALFNAKDMQIDTIIKHGCEIISQMTHLTSVMLGPDANEERLNKVQLVPLSETSALAVFITDLGHIEHKIFNIPDNVSMKDLEKCVEIINERITGTVLSNIIEKVEAIKPIIAQNVKQHEAIFRAFLEAFLSFTNENVSVFGRANILEQPEFADNLDKLKELVKLFESDEMWKDFASQEDIKVMIGEENEVSNLEDIGMVTAKIDIDGLKGGQIALVGPKRMDYDRAIRLLEYFKQAIRAYYKESEDSLWQKKKK